MVSFLKKGQTAGLGGVYTVTSVRNDDTFSLKEHLGKELIVRPATEEDLNGIFALVKSVQITGSDIGDRIEGRKGLGRSIGKGGLFSDYTGRKTETLNEFRMLVGTPYLLVAVENEEILGFAAGFPADKAANRKEAEGYADWKSHVQWNDTATETNKYVVLDPIVVALGSRKRGVGETLMRALLQNCANTGVDELHAEVICEPVMDTALLNTLDRLGFDETGRTSMKLKLHGSDKSMTFGARVFSKKIE